VGPRNCVLDGVEIPPREGAIFGFPGQLKNIVSLCCKRNHSDINNGVTWDAAFRQNSFNHLLLILITVVRADMYYNYWNTCLRHIDM